MNFRSLIFFLLIFTSMNCFAHTELGEPEADKGILDLSSHLSLLDENITLDGQWEFYWNELLSPKEFGRSNAEPEFINVPGSWTLVNDYPAWGYGTLRVRIKGLKPRSLYSLYIPDMVSNYNLWIDGHLLSSNGVVGKIQSDSKPQFLPKILTFAAEKDTTEIVIQISNFDYRKSGIWRSIFLGTQQSIDGFRDKRVMMEVFLVAILLSIFLFHIGIYLYRKMEKTEFLFGIICLTFLIRIITTGEQLLTYFIPLFPWEILRRMEYIPFYASAPLLALFLSSLFPKECSKWVNRIYVGICSILGLFIMVTPVRISNNTMGFAQIMMIVGIVYALIMMIRALIRRREGAFLITLAYFIFSITVVNDILYSNQIIQTLYVTPLGFVIFIIIQSQMLTRRFTRSFTQRELLAKSRDKFKHASITDSLTGLFNVRYLHQTIEKEMLEAIESSKSLSVIMADVDNFKLYNDTWGHKQGDEVLKKMAGIIRKSARENDSPCRYGGEEFSVVLPDTEIKEAAEVSERIRLRFELAEDKDERMQGITVSIGVAQYKDGESVDSIIERADKALYEAKHKGKNRVELAR